jgi:hypothetical protein
VFKYVSWLILLTITFTVTVVSSFLLVMHLERLYYPVVEGFEITKVQTTNNEFLISGTMELVRECRFVEVVAYYGMVPLVITFKDRPKGAATTSRALGLQQWGPWILTPPFAPTKIVSRHICHPGWDTITVLLDATEPKRIK